MKKEVKEKEVGQKEEKKPEVLVTSRVLFISALDKIYLVILGLIFLGFTINIFSGNITELNYNFWSRIGNEITLIFIMLILYLIFNWFYKCAVKTILCLTKNEVYKEEYIPFKRTETSIPISKISKVSTVNVFWIFRSIIIHQYHHFPLIFMTWNNQEFKDELSKLITSEKENPENIYENRNIITNSMYKYLAYAGIGLVGIIVLLGIIRFFAYMFNDERSLVGTYKNENESITLLGSGNCELDGIVDDLKSCTWSYDSDDKKVNVYYSYDYTYYYYSSSKSDSMELDYSKNTLKVNGKEYTKK